MLSADGRILSGNRALWRFLGVGEEDAQRPDSIIFSRLGNLFPALGRYLAAACATGDEQKAKFSLTARGELPVDAVLRISRAGDSSRAVLTIQAAHA